MADPDSPIVPQAVADSDSPIVPQAVADSRKPVDTHGKRLANDWQLSPILNRNVWDSIKVNRIAGKQSHLIRNGDDRCRRQF